MGRSLGVRQQAATVRRAKRARQLARGNDNLFVTAELACSTTHSLVEGSEHHPTARPNQTAPEAPRQRKTEAERLAKEAHHCIRRRPDCYSNWQRSPQGRLKAAQGQRQLQLWQVPPSSTDSEQRWGHVSSSDKHDE